MKKAKYRRKRAIKQKNKPRNKAQLTIIGTNLKNNSPPQEKKHINGTKYAKVAKKRTKNGQTTDNQALTSYPKYAQKTAPLAGW